MDLQVHRSFLQKPFNLRTLGQKVREMLSKAAVAATAPSD